MLCKISHRQAQAKIKQCDLIEQYTESIFVTSKSGENSAGKTCLPLYTAYMY